MSARYLSTGKGSNIITKLRVQRYANSTSRGNRMGGHLKRGLEKLY